MKRIFLSIILGGAVLFTACKKDEVTTEPSGNVTEVSNLDLTQATSTSFVYFSFDKNSVVEVEKPAESTDWDIAFSQYDVITRGTINSGKKVFTEVTETPTTSYTADVERYTFAGRVVAKNTSSPLLSLGYSEGFWQFITDRGIINSIPEADREVAKASLVHNNGPFTFGYGATGPVFTSNDWVYIVKTAAGKYAKIQVISYTNDKNAPFFISFKYQVSNNEGKF